MQPSKREPWSGGSTALGPPGRSITARCGSGRAPSFPHLPRADAEPALAAGAVVRDNRDTVTKELSPSEAATRIGATTRSVQRWIATGALPARRVGGRWRVAI